MPHYLTLIVLAGTALLGWVAGTLGCFAVLRRRALMGDLVSHAALPGLCLAFLVIGGRHFSGMLLGALVTGLLGVGLITFLCRHTRTKEDAALGIVLSTFFGAGIVLSSLIQQQPDAGKAGLETYIFGQAAGMIRQDLYLIAAVSAVALLLVLLLYKEFKLLSFDPEFARAQGWPTLGLDLLMMGALAVVTVVGLPAVGVVLMAAMLILPAAAARFWTERLGPMLVLAGLLGALSGAVGTLVSAGLGAELPGLAWLSAASEDPARAGLPTGPVIVLCGTLLFVLSLMFGPRRGVLARAIRLARLRSKTARENLLRAIFEATEQLPRDQQAVAVEQLLVRRAWSRGRLGRLLRRATRSGLVVREGARVRLTSAGRSEAQRLVRTHRLWELFLIRGAQIAPDHVDRDADTLEHLLPAELVEQVETELAASSQLEADATAVPDSPHPTLAAAPSDSTSQPPAPPASSAGDDPAGDQTRSEH